MNRTNFLSRGLQYLFSIDIDLGASRRKRRDSVGDLCGVLSSDVAQFTADSESVVYNALGETQVGGEPAITGFVNLAQDKIDFPPGREYGEMTGRLVIRTPDGSMIESAYTGVLRSRTSWPLLTRDYGAEKDAPEVEAKAQLTTRFETGAAKYRWLVSRQCAGFGCLRLRGGEPTWASFDIYSLSGYNPRRHGTHGGS